VEHVAQHSGGAWWKTVSKMLLRVHSANLTARLDLSPSASVPVPMDSPGLADEIGLVQMNFNFLVDLASNRCWSQMFYSTCLPYTIAQAFLPNIPDRSKARGFWKLSFAAVLKVEELMETSKACRELAADIATNVWQLTRELMCIGKRCDWDPASEELRSVAFAIAAGPVSTKFTLEDVFNWLQDTAARQSKSKKMNCWVAYMYTTLAPFSETGGLPQVEVSKDTYRARAHCKLSGYSEVMKSATFNLNRTPLPDEIASCKPAQIKKWRPAGFHANRATAAAWAFAMQDAVNNFSHINIVWSGALSVILTMFVCGFLACEFLACVVFTCHSNCFMFVVFVCVCLSG
jgi:hypothetical protein